MKITSAIWLWPKLNHRILTDRLIELTQSEMHRAGFKSIISSDITEIFKKSRSSDFLLVQAMGHIFLKITREEIEKWCYCCPALTCHIIDGLAPSKRNNGFGYWIHPQAFLVNLNNWNNIGRPKFGLPTKSEISVPTPIRSSSNIHHDYTPEWIKGIDQPHKRKQNLGWFLLKSIIESNTIVDNWNKTIRKNKCYPYPESKLEYEYWTRLQKITSRCPSTRLQIKNYCNRLIKEKYEGIYYENTENDGDIPKKPVVEQLIALPSGFKANRILHRMGFTQNTEVIYYDINPNQLEAKRRCVEEWNGWELEKFASDKFAIGLNTWKEQILKCFKTKEQWLAHWNRYKQLSHNYILCDITKQSNLLPIRNNPSTTIWFSNIFNYRPYVSRHWYGIRLKEYNELKKNYFRCKFIGFTPEKYH